MSIQINGFLDGLKAATASGWVHVAGDTSLDEVQPLITISVRGDVIAEGLAIYPRPDIEKLGGLAFGFSLKLKREIRNLKSLSELNIVASYRNIKATLRIYKPIEIALLTPGVRTQFPKDSGISVHGYLPPLHMDSWLEAPVVVHANLAPNNLIQIGAFTGIYGGKLGHCRIGRYCSIASDVNIASDQHPTNWLSTSMVQYVPNLHGWGDWLKRSNLQYSLPKQTFKSNAVVTIGHDVWIGQGVFIKSGVTIGNGAVIAAHSVVIDDVPAYGIVAGVPARLKKYRFSEKIIEQLQALCWWDYNIQAVADSIDFANVELAIDHIKGEIDAGRLSRYCAPIYTLGV